MKLTASRALTVTVVLTVVAVLTATAVGPLIPRDGTSTVTGGFTPPGQGLPLGGDSIGRDVLARVLHGGAGLLAVAVAATVVSVSAGVVLGLLLTVDSRISSMVAAALDIALVIPGMLVMLMLVYGLGGGTGTMILIATVVNAPFVARFTRSLVAPLRDADFVTAARLAGDGTVRTLVREILPVVAGPLATDAGARFVGSLYMVAAAGFLGFRPLGTDGDWATMIQTGLDGLALNPWASAGPALAVVLVTVPVNLLVDRLAERSRL